MSGRRWIGRAYLAVGALHLLGAGLIYGDHYAAILADGVFATVDDYSVRTAAYWFVVLAPMLAIVGILIDAFEARRLPVPAAAPAIFTAALVVMVAVMPVSGAWLLFVPTIALLRRSLKRA